jgi:phage/plasmid-like protein (TIGR03299 family)
MIERSAVTGKAEIAYVGAHGKPWHSLGQDVTLGAPIEVWRVESGCNFDVLESMVMFQTATGLKNFGDRKVLYRSDTEAPLAAVSRDYQTFQVKDAFEFFRELCDKQGFTIETAGCLQGGKRIWVLAKMSEGSNVIGSDRVLPYLLLATSFDGSMATVVKFTAIRVVCHNTITMALNSGAAECRTQTVSHSTKFDEKVVKKNMGLYQDGWTTWLAQAKKMAEAPLSLPKAEELTAVIAARTIKLESRKDEQMVKDSKAFRKIMGLFVGDAIGSDLAQGETCWQWLNSVTEYVDHHKGVAPDSRMNRAWFGDGDSMKTQAFELVEEIIA